MEPVRKNNFDYKKSTDSLPVRKDLNRVRVAYKKPANDNAANDNGPVFIGQRTKDETAPIQTKVPTGITAPQQPNSSKPEQQTPIRGVIPKNTLSTPEYTSSRRVKKTLKTNRRGTVTPARRTLRRKIESDATGKLQQRYLKLIPNPIARGAAKLVLKNFERVETAAVSVELLAETTAFWLTFQLPLAALSLVFAGATYYVHDYIKPSDDAGIIMTSLYWVGEKAVSIFTSIAKSLYGVSLDPADMFLALNTMVFFLGFMILVYMTLRYTMCGISCFLGRGAGLKTITFTLALFMYILPFFNLFPWFMLWAYAVNKNP